ncbi:hypothetical protein [Thiolapillus sp.]|uniref:hypothetical protein n=1 Tax=Thiolapillus sp. TaxID=2017437 RepID=UPI003AF95B2D
MTDYTNLPAELMAIHVAIQIFLDRYEDDAGPVIYDSMTKLSENIIEGLRNENL